MPRTLRRNPAFTGSALLALALGIGVTAPLLSLLRAGVLWRLVPPPPAGIDLAGESDWRADWSGSARLPSEIRAEGMDTLLSLLGALAGVVLGVACLNLMALLLARASARGHEMATRATLGAGPLRLTRQLLTEGTLLGVAGAVLGVGLGAAVLKVLRTLLPVPLPGWPGGTGEPLAVTTAAGAALLTVLVFSLAPLRATFRRNLHAALTTAARATPGRHEGDARRLLVTLMVAASLVLLVSAGLLLRSLPATGSSVGPGFDARDTLTFGVELPGGSAKERAAALEALYVRLAALPGAESASVSTAGAWGGIGTTDLAHALTGNPAHPGILRPTRYHAVSPGFFRALGVPVLQGREFLPSDGTGAPGVAVVSRTFADRFLPSLDPVGKVVQLGGARLEGPWYQVVGVVDEVRAPGVGSGAEPFPALYLSALQHPPRTAAVAVRARGEPRALLPAVRGALRSVHPALSPRAPSTLEAELRRAQAPIRWFARVFGGMAAVAVLLSAAGLYGVIAYGVARRTREIGVRMALGARAGEVVRMVVGQSLRLVTVGALLGGMVALGLARLLQLLFFGVDPTDVGLYAGVVGVLWGAALLASALPARRAARVDPSVALRAE
jgi:putative ABC transport system permease protein